MFMSINQPILAAKESFPGWEDYTQLQDIRLGLYDELCTSMRSWCNRTDSKRLLNELLKIDLVMQTVLKDIVEKGAQDLKEMAAQKTKIIDSLLQTNEQLLNSLSGRNNAYSKDADPIVKHERQVSTPSKESSFSLKHIIFFVSLVVAAIFSLLCAGSYMLHRR